jgi:ribosome recycling factor
MTSERREDLLKILGKKVEECKVSIRNIRKEFNNSIRDAKQAKKISENFYNRLCDVLQQVTEKFCSQADHLGEKKKTEITTV